LTIGTVGRVLGSHGEGLYTPCSGRTTTVNGHDEAK
jgi:hypothetical protein